jgi:hypothetical protein
MSRQVKSEKVESTPARKGVFLGERKPVRMDERFLANLKFVEWKYVLEE